MQINTLTKCVAFVLVLMVVGVARSTTQAVCTYRNSEDETIFLTYMPLIRKSEDYVDFNHDGTCIRRAFCTDKIQTEVEECSAYKISCVNKHRFTGVFPGCCIRCPL